mmetsp:Transcript_5570/g.18016  ORF Transcript_5570/g.18016 Transcript_5570/m.18016 type:complete len:215 (+) Transcript_5570:234-878(+)
MTTGSCSSTTPVMPGARPCCTRSCGSMAPSAAAWTLRTGKPCARRWPEWTPSCRRRPLCNRAASRQCCPRVFSSLAARPTQGSSCLSWTTGCTSFPQPRLRCWTSRSASQARYASCGRRHPLRWPPRWEADHHAILATPSRRRAGGSRRRCSRWSLGRWQRRGLQSLTASCRRPGSAALPPRPAPSTPRAAWSRARSTAAAHGWAARRRTAVTG